MRYILIFSTVALLSLAGCNKQENTGATVKLSCGLAEALIEGGAEEGATYMTSTLASHWPEKLQGQLADITRQQLSKPKYIAGTVYSTAEIGDELQAHLITMQVEQFGLFFIRLIYQKIGSDLAFAHIEMKGKYSDLQNLPFEHEPVKLACEQSQG